MKHIITSLLVIAGFISVAGFAFAERLDARTQQALVDAIHDEYKAKALYQGVLEKFGDVRPFSAIVKAEQVHIRQLLLLFQRYGVDVPQDNWAGKVPEFDTVQDACEAGVQAEIENADMYDEFFSFVKEADIRATFTRLRNASEGKHLPAFQRCADGNAPGSGRPGRPGRGPQH